MYYHKTLNYGMHSNLSVDPKANKSRRRPISREDLEAESSRIRSRLRENAETADFKRRVISRKQRKAKAFKL